MPLLLYSSVTDLPLSQIPTDPYRYTHRHIHTCRFTHTQRYTQKDTHTQRDTHSDRHTKRVRHTHSMEVKGDDAEGPAY